MDTNEILSTYIKKLSHPLQEIRERSLQLLFAKMQLGWTLNDELRSNSELLEALLAWFNIQQQPSMQREALELLLRLIKTKGGNYAVREYNIHQMLEVLYKIKPKVERNSLELFEEIVDSLKFLNTVESSDNMNIPRLNIPSTSSINSNYESGGLPNEECNSNRNLTSEADSVLHEYNSNHNIQSNGVNVILFPWVVLSPSDYKTIVLIEDSLKIVKSTRRCCRFIRDVFLSDFSAEIFLNRPSIIKALLAISDGQLGSSPSEALHVLLCITKSLHKRLKQLLSAELICEHSKVPYDNRDSYDNVNVELEQIVGRIITPNEDKLAALRQLPAPIFALDTAHNILCIMAKSVQIETTNKEILTMKELSLCICLVEELTKLLLDLVDDSFWVSDHSSKVERDIAHKSCMTMRMLGDLLMKYHNLYQSDQERLQHRVAWFRLLSCAAELLYWARKSPLPPTSLCTALQMGLLDPGIDIFYPELNKRMSVVLQCAQSAVDQEFKSRYRELKKIFTSMDHAVEFMQKPGNNQNILSIIKNAIPVLHIYRNERFLTDIAEVLMAKKFDGDDWSIARDIALSLMAHSIPWVQGVFYKILENMVKAAFKSENEMSLNLLCDVGVLTEICCQGLSCSNKEVQESASEVMLYLLRGRLVLSEKCWWRLLASLMPVLPLLHVYAAHETQLGKAICKSLEADIVECMGVSKAEMVWGLVRLLFVKCPAVQMYAAHSLCGVLDDAKYLPPKETLRTDILINALRRVEIQDFNVDQTSSPDRKVSTTGLIQVLEVLKQDLVLDGSEYMPAGTSQTLEPSLRRSTLQQLAVMMRQQGLHDAFVRYDGVRIIDALLRMSLTVDDYLAFPECALSCVSVLNSICFAARHELSKMAELPLFLLRAILIFPANENHVTMSAQVLGLLAWAGFVLQELDDSRQIVPALPSSVTQRVNLPFTVNTYWITSPNAEHGSVDWLLNETEWRTAIRIRWHWVLNGGKKVRGSPHLLQSNKGLNDHDLELLRSACVDYSCTKGLLNLENATTHMQVNEALCVLESYIHVMSSSTVCPEEFGSLKWLNLKRFLISPPASARDTDLLIVLLQFIVAYMDNVPKTEATMSWVKSSFIGNEAAVIALLSRDRLYPQQTPSEDIDVIQLRIYIVKVLLRCIIMEDGFRGSKMESLLKILFACLERVELKNFHMLGYLKELLCCIRYALHSQCDLSEEALLHSLKMITRVLSGCSSSAGRKGQACRLDAMLALMAVLKKIKAQDIPVQRWGEYCDGFLTESVIRCVDAQRPELRAAAIQVTAALACYTQLLPQILQYIPDESLCRYALDVFAKSGEANVVRASALALLTTVTSSVSPHNQVLERDLLMSLDDYSFVEECLQILIDFCNSSYSNDISYLEPNMPLALLEKRAELEVRSQKSQDVIVSPTHGFEKPPPTGDLITAIADVFTNVSMLKNSPIQSWNERGLYRVMFRCLSRSEGMIEQDSMSGSICRTLCVAVRHKCVRALLASTKDCLHYLIDTLRPIEADNEIFARTQATLLLGYLLSDTSASDTFWWELKKNNSNLLFEMLLQFLESDDIELQSTAMFCLTQLAQSIHKGNKHTFIDNVRSGSVGLSDCQPEYIVEELCKILMEIFKEHLEKKNFLTKQDETWSSLCSCMASVLSVSPRSRMYAVHRRFPTVLNLALQAFRDKLSLQGKPMDVIRNANSEPILNNLYWVLMLANSSMLDCAPSKERLSEDVTSHNKLWPWYMMTEPLRDTIMHLLLTFTNDNPKGWSAMCACVSGRSLASEVCALVSREASRPRASHLLPLALRVLTHCTPNQHCRSLILKTDVISCACKLRARNNDSYTEAWYKLCEALSRHADGASALINVLSSPTLRPIPRPLLTSLAHAAHHQRLAFLQSPDLLEVLSGSLLTGDTSEIVSASRAVWALAANNHRAKLVLRSSGITTAVQTTMQRLQRSNDVAAQRALQLLTYTYNILQT
ncbi:rotatin [Pieris rapae]|uniref:rotatin n=1 Tax=Pieris rapae TaxID=64459 RepID=UPI001E27AE76|nr:rotatin [Pieris rapae]